MSTSANVVAVAMIVSMVLLVDAQQPGVPGIPNIPGMPNIPGIPGLTPTPTPPNSGSACNFRYMLTKYNGCQSYVLTGKGANLQEECCSPMAKVAHECGCVAMLRPFANSLLGICNSPPCTN